MHLLLVEDERRLAVAVRRVLEEEGHAVDVSDDGANALAQAQAETYDVIVLDVTLPSMNGFDVARKLRATKDHTPILMLTARDGIADRVQGLDAGADDYLVKPFALAELTARIRALGPNSPPAAGTVTVRSRRLGSRWALSVTDTGPGIPEEAQSRVVDRFFRVDEARSGQSGTGLGLSIARWIAEAHHGRSAAASRHGNCGASVARA